MPVSNGWLLLLFPFVIAASVLAAEPQGPVEREVLTVDMRRFDAMVKGDVAALDGLIAGDATYVNDGGRIDDKQSILYGIRSRTTTYKEIIPTERRVRVTGNVAIVFGVAVMRGVDRATAVDLTVRYMAAYERRAGRWQMIAGQSTEIVPTNTVISGQSA